MTHDSDTERCPLTDLVLAHFLDGACDDASVEQREELRAHREECVVCRAALERARRLDALLAAHAPTSVPDDRVDVWIETALQARRAPSATASRRRVPLRLAAALFLLACGAAFGAWLARRDVPQHPGSMTPVAQEETPAPVLPRVEAPPPQVESIAVDPVAIRGLPPALEMQEHAVLRRRQPTVEIDPAVLAIGLESPLLPVLRGLCTHLPGVLAARTARLADGSCVEWCERLLRSGRVDTVFDVVDRLPDDFRLATLCAAVARSSEMVATLRAQIRSGERVAMRAAARIGGTELDAALADAAVADDARLLQITDALHSRRVRPGRAALSMRILGDVVARGNIQLDELSLAQRMFAAADASDAAWLASRLESSRSAPERRRALLALGVIAEPSTAPVLLRALRSVRVDEMDLAAWALGRMPLGTADGALDVDVRRRALQLAARASRHEPSLEAVIRRLSITPEERSFLLAGSFSPEQIGIAARLFRERVAAGD